MNKSIFTTILIVVLSFTTYAQKKALSPEDFANWNLIKNRQISDNGNFVSYELNAQKGDGNLIIYNSQLKQNDTIRLGYDAAFSPNSDFIACKLKLTEDSIRQLKLAKTKKDKMPKDSLVIFNLKNQSKKTFPNLNSFKVAEEKSSWMAFLYDYTEPKADTLAQDSIAADTTKTLPKKKAAKKKKEKDRKDLLVLNPMTNQSFTFNRVQEYALAKEGKTLALISKLNDTTKIQALIVFNTETLITDTLLQDSLSFKKLTLDKPGNQLAYLASADTSNTKIYSLFYTSLEKLNIDRVVDTLTANMPNKWSISENGGLYFSDDASKLFAGIAPKPQEKKNDSILDEEIPKLDVWSWTDKELQPMQLKNLDKEKKRTYLSVYRIKDKKFIPLADTIVKSVRLVNKNNGEWALGSDDSPYIRATSWNATWLDDYYLVNLKNGEKQLLMKGKSQAWLSPQGKYTVYYELSDSCYYAINNKSGAIKNLTGKLPVSFCNELNDVPNDPYPYGIAGWAADDKALFIYDRFDIWQLDPSGKKPAINITLGQGRKTQTRFRYVKLDRELVYIPTTEPVLIEWQREQNYKAGYSSLQFDTPGIPHELLSGDFSLGSVQKAKATNQIIWSTQTVKEFPEVKYSSLNFSNPLTISESNSQQDTYNWITAELVEWVSFANDTLKGILYKPEDFDASKKYPMLVYFYERSSDDIHRYFYPTPSRSVINRTLYCSNGYLVFVPDIVYTTGYPGQNAYDAIVSGVQYLADTRSYVDRDHMGLQGQSWGGYQTAYLVTQTDMFAAAMAGAPVSNMTSAYGGIRWGTGMSRMFQYEHTQSRIGGTLWDKTMQYIENSPVFFAPKVNTPLLMMHNDHDGAVPWYQGIEYFVALRRLNKPVWLLSYNGMDHNIESKYWANRMDLSRRMFQFFNHYLKNEPAPEWMKNGLPAIKKGEELGY